MSEALKERMESRQADFKRGIDGDDARRGRDEALTSIRKNKREDKLAKRRQGEQIQPQQGQQQGQGQQQQGQGQQQQQGSVMPNIVIPATGVTDQDLQRWRAKLMAQTPDEAFEGTVAFRKILSLEKNPPIQKVIDAGVLPRLVWLCTAASSTINTMGLTFVCLTLLLLVVHSQAQYPQYTCDEGNHPCTPENAAAQHFYFTHTTPDHFVQCSEWGSCYVMPCAPGTLWDQDLLTCAWAGSSSTDPCRTDPPPKHWTCQRGRNPCTPANAAAGKFYFQYVTDNKYVQCDAFGRCWVRPCAPGTRWRQQLLTCDHY